MHEQVVPLAVAQCITVKFLSNKNVKTDLMRLESTVH
jgi:hypothetical protein